MTSDYPSTGAAVDSIKRKILDIATTSIAAANEVEVDITMGFRWPAQWFDAVAVTAVRATPAESTVGTRRRQHVNISQDVEITVFRVTDDEGEVHDRAYQLLDIIDSAIRADASLAGAALWCYAEEVTSDGLTTNTDAGQGRIAGISVTFVSRVMITRPA